MGKLARCIAKVRAKGKSKSSAAKICVTSTGIKKKKGGGCTAGKTKRRKK